jgi:hypothetical protein
MDTLRDLLLQRAARLQDRPALTGADGEALGYAALRRRVEGVAMGLLLRPEPRGGIATTGTAWDWVAELALATSGLPWDPQGEALPPALLGGEAFHPEAGRGALHALEHRLTAATPFTAGLTHGDLLRRLQRLNPRLGWDHETTLRLPGDGWSAPALRAALWNALYAGAHAVVGGDGPWDATPFQDFWEA